LRAHAESVYYRYVIRVPDREALADHLHYQGMEAGLHYPKAVHETVAYASLGYGPGDLPRAEAVYPSFISRGRPGPCL
jgi:dTDP-4-amino-4,6-dideoxygalactose transaminase